MRKFDESCADQICARLAQIAPDAKPAWGRMNGDQVVAHLADTVRYTLGERGEHPNVGNFAFRVFVWPLLSAGFLKIPKNVNAVRKADGSEPDPSPPADVETVRELCREYFRRRADGSLAPPRHPVFGDIGVRGWDRMHVMHFEHHLKQFGV